jgi:hypothetical protein
MSKKRPLFAHIHHQDSNTLSVKKPIVKFTMEVEANRSSTFLDALVMKRGPKLPINFHRKPTSTVNYLHFKPNRLHHVKKGVVHDFISRVIFLSGSYGYQQGK